MESSYVGGILISTKRRGGWAPTQRTESDAGDLLNARLVEGVNDVHAF